MGSHSYTGAPYQNAVVERMNRTFKLQLLESEIKIPTKVKKTRDLQNIIAIKKDFINNRFLAKKNLGLTSEEYELQHKINLKNQNLKQPNPILIRKNQYLPAQQSELDILNYRKDLRFWNACDQEYHELFGNKMDKMVQMAEDTQFGQNLIHEQNKLLSSKIDVLLDRTAPKTKIKHIAEIQRDPITNTIFEDILKSEKPKSSN